MDSETKNTQCPYVSKGPDWRNTIHKFVTVAVVEHKLKPHDIAVYLALYADVKRNGTISIGCRELMKRSGISDYRSFKKARDKLTQLDIISIVKNGSCSKENTTYKVKLLGKPVKKERDIETETSK